MVVISTLVVEISVVLVCHVMFARLHDSRAIDRNFLRYVTIVSSLMAISTVLVEI